MRWKRILAIILIINAWLVIRCGLSWARFSRIASIRMYFGYEIWKFLSANSSFFCSNKKSRFSLISAKLFERSDKTVGLLYFTRDYFFMKSLSDKIHEILFFKKCIKLIDFGIDLSLLTSLAVVSTLLGHSDRTYPRISNFI